MDTTDSLRGITTGTELTGKTPKEYAIMLVMASSHLSPNRRIKAAKREVINSARRLTVVPDVYWVAVYEVITKMYPRQ